MTDEYDQVQDLLQKGIQAIKAKNKTLARDLLSQVCELEPQNVSAWFWLSAAIDDPKLQEQILLKVIEMDPNNELAGKGLTIAQQHIIALSYEQGVAAAIEGQKDLARELLTEVVERDENNLAAWEWLSQVVETSEDQEICFNNIIMLDPENDAIREKLVLLRQTREMAEQNPWIVDEIADQQKAIIAPTLAGDILGDPYREKYTTIIPEPEPEPEPRSVALWAKYEDNLLCPYCANPTEHKLRRCPACKNPLWISRHTTESRSTLLWIVVLMQAMTTIILAVVPLIILFIVAQRINLYNFFSLLPTYFGLPSPLNLEIQNAAFNILPRFWFYLSLLPALASLIFAIALYLRWAPVYYLLLVGAGIGLVGSIVGLASFPTFVGSVFAGVLGVLLSLSTLIMVIKLESDFRKSRRRIYLEIDPDVKEGMSFLIRGKQYGRRGMWALSAIHLRRAIGLIPYEEAGYIATAVACSHLHDYELGLAVLEDALSVDSDNARIQQAIDVIKTAQVQETASDESIQRSTSVQPNESEIDNELAFLTEQEQSEEADQIAPGGYSSGESDNYNTESDNQPDVAQT